MKKHLYKHPKSIHQHKKKSFKPKPKFGKAGFRWIEDLHNIHKGKEIWVLGSGWSIDEFPDNFFKHKLTIAHRAASMAFPSCSYVWAGYQDYKIGKIKKFLESWGKSGFKKIIFGLSGKIEPSGLKWLKKNRKYPIYMEKQEVRMFREFKSKIKTMAKCIMRGSHCRCLCYSTTIHFSIEAAIILGASKITLVGCSHREEKGKLHAQKKELSNHYPPQNFPAWGKARLGTGLLVQTFKPYGISIRRYFFGKGYERIPLPKELLNPKGTS